MPIALSIDEVKKHLTHSNTLIVNAPPGAGKSTVIPLTLLDAPWLAGKKIIMLEPRRLAARTIASRLAELWGDALGQTIGYRIRFETKVSAKTRLEVVTEGILTRMLQSDNALQDVGLVIFDEFHERSLHADLALALCREAQQILRPDLHILIMSATLDMPQLTAMLHCPVVVSEGKQYPVEVKYTGGQDAMVLPEMTAKTVMQAVRENEGDALVFLPGEGEIKKCAALLEDALPGFAIHPLYGQLHQREQNMALTPNRFGKRKIVLATSIAETSLTIEGIRIVVDCGLSRISRFDPGSGLSRLETVMVTQDSADQRAGRAGRLSAGICYRMWTQATHQRLQKHRIPEILEADLSSLMLEMAMWGVQDISRLTWLTPPPQATIASAQETLEQLNAVEKGKITEHGKQLHALPCHPRIAHMMLKAQEDNAVALAADIAALLEERDPMPRDSGIDINLRIELLRRTRAQGKPGNKLARIEKIAAQYRNLLKAEVDNNSVDVFETGLLLAYAYPERIACARTGNNAQFQLANGKIATAGHRDDLAHESWLAVANMDARDGLGKIFLAAPLNPKDLLPLVKEKETIQWDLRKGSLQATKDLRIGSIVLKSVPLKEPDAQLVEEALKQFLHSEGEKVLNFDEHTSQLQNRILSLRQWNPDQDWPDVRTSALLQGEMEWLMPFTIHARKNEDLEKLNLGEAIHSSLNRDQQELLNRLAPEKIEVPSGSKIMVTYFANGDTPILAVRLQEVFGLADTPKVNQGKNAVVMHLLSPGYKPVQITGDLRSFWNNTYFEVKKELQRRYPKHAWPDEPWEAKAVAKGRPKK
ncbi:MAG: ATP-dependent helicase HrpB [Bacteroidia bacterium]